MKQIKVKELPVDGLITDTHYQSGNAGFINVDVEKESIGGSEEGDCFVYENDDGADINFEEIQRLFGLGTKHIQLKAANCNKSTLGRYFSKPCKGYPTCRYNAFTEQNAYAEELRELGKDFFIYKVSEEK